MQLPSRIAIVLLVTLQACSHAPLPEPPVETTRQMTHPRFSYPTWTSSDTILYESNVSGNWEIWEMSTEGLLDGGGELVQITTNPAADRMPALSPDGRSIAFLSDRDGDLELFVMNRDGSDQRQLTFNEVAEIHPYWTPDGTRIIFNRRMRDERVYELRMIDPQGTGDRLLLNDGELNSYASLSPDGKVDQPVAEELDSSTTLPPS